MTLATVAAALLASACTNNDDDFADGRDTETVWLISPTPFSEDDGQVQLDLIADTFDWPHRTPFEDTFLTGPIEGTGWNTRGYQSPNGDGSLSVSNLNNQWGYASDAYTADEYCRATCTPLPFGEEEAIERSRGIFTALGLDPDKFSYRTAVSTNDEDQAVSILTIASYVVAGKTTSLEWVVGYRNAEGQVDRASGHFVTVSELGDVPILTPTEALTLAGREPTTDTLNNTTLTLETQYDRETNQYILIPVYSVPVSDNLNTNITITATRTQDIPWPDQDT